VAVATPLALLLAASRNRAGEPEAEVRLTERELRLVPVGEGKRWAVLRLDWNRHLERDRKEAGWLDGAKLASLGFDTRLPVDAKEAVGFYDWLPPRKVFLALEYDGEAAAKADSADPAGRATRSRLHAVDADLEARALRGRHPDRARVLVVRAVVSAECQGRWDPVTRTLSAPFLRGRVDRLLVEEIHLPRGERTLLDALASGEPLPKEAGAVRGSREARGTPSGDQPRYSALFRTGRRFEPWVVDVRPTAPPSALP
jgi:hypothetical protein